MNVGGILKLVIQPYVEPHFFGVNIVEWHWIQNKDIYSSFRTMMNLEFIIHKFNFNYVMNLYVNIMSNVNINTKWENTCVH